MFKITYKYQPWYSSHESEIEKTFANLKAMSQYLRRMSVSQKEKIVSKQIHQNSRWQNFIIEGKNVITEDDLKAYNVKLKVFPPLIVTKSKTKTVKK